jgi:LysR family glycine cleavage system transcriptional activator
MRFNNRVTLTDAGHLVYAGAAEALEQISALTRATMSVPARARLVVSVLPSVADRWLVPRLAGFLDHQPDLRVDLRVEEDPVDFARHEIDLRICYGSNLYPELRSVLLVHDRVEPMCSPDYRARHPDIADVPDDDLIHTNWGPSFGSHPTWQDWFARRGLARQPRDASGHRAGMSSLALDLARAGLGVALGQRLMAEGDLKSGKLVTLSDLSVNLGHPYSIIHAPAKARKAGLAPLIDWLTGTQFGL